MKKMLPIIASFLLGASLAASTVAYAEAQPHMREALRLLQDARAQLDKAEADKGGHRVAAIGKVDEAIVEVRAGMDFDNKR